MPIDDKKADRLVEVYEFLTGLSEGKIDKKTLTLKDGAILLRDTQSVEQGEEDTILVEDAAASNTDESDEQGEEDTIPVEDAAAAPEADVSELVVDPDMINLLESPQLTQQTAPSNRKIPIQSIRARQGGNSRGTRKQRKNRK